VKNKEASVGMDTDLVGVLRFQKCCQGSFREDEVVDRDTMPWSETCLSSGEKKRVLGKDTYSHRIKNGRRRVAALKRAEGKEEGHNKKE